MTSMYNKYIFFLLVGCICIRNKDHQMNFKKHTNDLISSSYV